GAGTTGIALTGAAETGAMQVGALQPGDDAAGTVGCGAAGSGAARVRPLDVARAMWSASARETMIACGPARRIGPSPPVRRPGPGGGEGTVPAGEKQVPGRGLESRLEAGRLRLRRQELAGVRPDAGREPRESGGAERRRLHDGGSADRDPDHV